MKVTHEESMRLYQELVYKQPTPELVPYRRPRPSAFKIGTKNIVAIVKTESRVDGIRETLRLLGGVKPLVENVKGEIIIKPNCNTDDPYPRDTHPVTARTIAEALIDAGAKPDQITVGDMSGRARGLPTRVTMENLGIKLVAEELGISLACFEEEEWVRVDPGLPHWPGGIPIPRRVYEAERLIFTPILRSHSTAAFTCGLKLGVGLINAGAREWLHNGDSHYEKLAQMNLAFSVDLVVSDAMMMNTGVSTDPRDEVSPGVIIASDRMASNDAAAVALMRYHDTVRVKDRLTKEHKQLTMAEELGVGGVDLTRIELRASNLSGDPGFDDLLNYVKSELEG